MKKTLPNGYLTCNKVKDHNKALFDCLRRKKTPMVGCGLHPVTCRFVFIKFKNPCLYYGLVCNSAHSLGAFQWLITSSITVTFNLN